MNDANGDVTVALRRLGAGLVVGALATFALSSLVLPEIAALVVVAGGMVAYGLERAGGRVTGASMGLAVAGVLVVLDRQLDPLGATLERSTAATVAIGVGVVVATLLVETDAFAVGDGE